MEANNSEKQHKCADRKLALVGRAKLTKADKVGFVEKKGRGRIKRGAGNVEIFFPEKEDKRTVRYVKRIFLAQYARYID